MYIEYMCIYIYMYIVIHLYMSIYLYIWHVWMHLIYSYVCSHIYIYIYIHTPLCAHKGCGILPYFLVSSRRSYFLAVTMSWIKARIHLCYLHIPRSPTQPRGALDSLHIHLNGWGDTGASVGGRAKKWFTAV